MKRDGRQLRMRWIALAGALLIGAALPPTALGQAGGGVTQQLYQEESNYARMRSGLARRLQNEAEWTAAVEELRSARTQLNEARQPIQSALWQDADFRNLQVQQLDLERQLRVLQEDSGPTPTEQTKMLAGQLLAIRKHISDAQAKAVAGNADVESARNTYTAAAARVAELAAEREHKLAGDPELAAARIDQRLQPHRGGAVAGRGGRRGGRARAHGC